MSADTPIPPAADPGRDDDMLLFGRYQLFPRLGLLLRDGTRLALGERAMAVLIQLVNRAGQAVSKDLLLASVWPGEVVEENNLQAQISALRKAFGPDRELISTLFGRGYCFTAEVSTLRAAISLSTISPSSAGLPRPRSPLIGRERELAEARTLLLSHKICTLVGPAGIGKTRLMLEVARGAAHAFTGGLYFADLSCLSGNADPAATLTTALAGLGDARLSEPALPQPALLVVDNCEHLAEACARELERLLQADERLSLLLTSQSPLGLDGERLYRLGPLALPDAGMEVAEAQRYGAIALIVQRIQAADHQFRLTGENVRQLVALCRLLDAVPLALEIAAARICGLGLEVVLQDLTSRAGMLDTGRRGTPSRHRTLGEALHWSYQLLGQSEQRVFQELGIFAGEFDLQAATQVLCAPQGERVIDIIGSLVDKSLLVFQSGTQPPRYRYLTIVRAYARQQLAERTGLLAEQHARFVGQRVAQARAEWMSVSSSQWRRQYGYLIDDLRAALDWCGQPGQDGRLGRQILANATPFWILSSRYDECRQRIAAALQGPEGVEPGEEMPMQAALGSALAWARGPIDENGQAWRRAGELASRLGDGEIRLQSEYGLWLYHLRSGLYASALENGHNMVQLAQTLGDRGALLTARRLIGTSRHFLGQQGLALADIRSFLDGDGRDAHGGSHFRFGLDQRVAGWSFLVRVLWVSGDVDQARRAAQLALEEATELDHACSLCCALAEGCCTLAALTGDVEQVGRIAQQIERLAGEHGLGFWRLYGAAFAFWARLRQYPETVKAQEIRAMLDLLQDNGFDPGYSLFLSDFAARLAELGQSQVALALLGARLASLTAAQSLWNAPELLRVQALIQHAGQPGSASLHRALQPALRLAREQGAEGWVARIERTLQGG